MKKFLFAMLSMMFSLYLHAEIFEQALNIKKIYFLTQKDSLPGATQINNDSVGDDKIVSEILAVREVKEKNKYIDSLSGHKSSISIIIIKRPDEKQKYYWVQAGYNSEIRFEPYYNFYIYPPGNTIKVFDTMSNEIFSLKEWRTRKKSHNHYK